MRREWSLIVLGGALLTSPSSGATIVAPDGSDIEMRAPGFGAAVVRDVAAMVRDETSRERLWAAISHVPRAGSWPSESRRSSALAGGLGETWTIHVPGRDDLATILSAGWPEAAEGVVHPRSPDFVAPTMEGDGEDDEVAGLAAGMTPQPFSPAPRPGPSGGSAGPSGARDQAAPDSDERPRAPDPASILLALGLLLMGGLPMLIDLRRKARRLRALTLHAGGIELPDLIAPHDRRGSRRGESPRERSRSRSGPLVFPHQLLPRDRREPDGG
jgi:hypothetical protein